MKNSRRSFLSRSATACDWNDPFSSNSNFRMSSGYAGIVFDPTRSRKVLGKFRIRATPHTASMVENENRGASGALIDGKDEFLSHLGLLPLCALRLFF